MSGAALLVEGEMEAGLGEGTSTTTTQQDQKGPAQNQTAKVQLFQEEGEEEEEPDDGVPRVLVTGASSYVALHIIKRLLEDGRFRVRGSLKSMKNDTKIQSLLNLVPDAKYPLCLVEARLSNRESWKEAVKGCSYVFHMSFPAPSHPSDSVVTLAVEGTLNVLSACAEAGTVKRVILTSSIAAISNGLYGIPGKPANYVYSEYDWSNEATCDAYKKSKLKAEQAAWQFIKDHPKFEMVVLNPGYVQGPVLSSIVEGDGVKALCLPLLTGQITSVPDITFSTIDVRDIVTAQMAALEKPGAAGRRYLLVSANMNFRDVAGIIAEEFRPQGYKVSTKNWSKMAMWFTKHFNHDARAMYPYVGRVLHFDNKKMVHELGVTPRCAKETILDTCYSLIEFGLVQKTPQYLGHPSTRHPPPGKQQAVANTPPAVKGPPAVEGTPAVRGPTAVGGTPGGAATAYIGAGDTMGAGADTTATGVDKTEEVGDTTGTGDNTDGAGETPGEAIPEIPGGGETPLEGGETPREGDETPLEGGETPLEGGETPLEGGETPLEGGKTPREGGETPREGDETPREGGETPREGGETPEGKDLCMWAGGKTLGGEDETPEGTTSEAGETQGKSEEIAPWPTGSNTPADSDTPHGSNTPRGSAGDTSGGAPGGATVTPVVHVEETSWPM